jgi:hypothetical protein
MTSTMNATGLTARTFLFASESEDQTIALRRTFVDHGATSAFAREFNYLSDAAHQAVGDALCSATGSLLEVDLGDLVVAGWRIHQHLVNAAQETLRVPGKEEVVQLGSHQITSTHHPTVDVLVDGVRVHTFRFRLTIVIDVEIAAVIVRAGEIVGLKAGDTLITGTFTLEDPRGDIQLIRRQGNVDLNRTIRLNRPVRLIPITGELNSL